MTDATLLKLQAPFTGLVSGPTGSGKTFLLRDLIMNPENIDPKIDEIYYYYDIWQKIFDEMTPRVIFRKGLPSRSFYESLTPLKTTLIVLDDVMTMAAQDDVVTDFFTKGSHHLACSILLVTQNLFLKSLRTISINSQYLWVFKSPRDTSQIAVIARQVCPKNSKFVIDAYKQATEVPFGYLMFDFKPRTPEELRYRTKIFDRNQIVFLPK